MANSAPLRAPDEARCASHEDLLLQLGAEDLFSLLGSLVREPVICGSVKVVSKMAGISDAAIWQICDPNSPTFDPEFPRYTHYATLRKTVWNLVAVQRYLQQMFERDKHQGEDICGHRAEQLDRMPISRRAAAAPTINSNARSTTRRLP